MPQDFTLRLRDAIGDYPLMIGLLGILALMILPLPPLLLDMLLAVNVTAGVVIAMTSIYVSRPLDFSVFPALLLVTTLFRLGLNVASTRLILLGAAEGRAEAGNIIETFGEFVVGGNLFVGVIVFLILVLINFMVITKGSGRIAEVAARFTLDALPGKQMSIDGELAQGGLSESEARFKRDQVQREADFYGAMDGASKFVRGDAIAGLLITAINLIGGLLIGVTQGGLSFGEAASSYAVLTVGDGLVSQIPALLISTAAGIIVTRAASAQRLSEELNAQLVQDERVLYGAGVMLLLLGLIPGMPWVIFAALAAALFFLARRVGQSKLKAAEEAATTPAETEAPALKIEPHEAIQTEQLALEIGYELIGLVDEKRGGDLVSKLFQLRRQFASELGLVVPSIHIRDNLELEPSGYRMVLNGHPIGRGRLRANRLLAIEPAELHEAVPGERCEDPTFGLPALWIKPEERWRAESAGYTVVELEAVLTTHATELVRAHCAELLTWSELHARLEALKQIEPQLVEATVPALCKPGDLLTIMRRLLSEGISIRDLRTILEAVGEKANQQLALGAIIEHVRSRLSAQISARYTSADGQLYAVVLARGLEDKLRQCLVHQGGESILACDLSTAQQLFSELEGSFSQFISREAEPTILTPPDLRAPLYVFLSQFFPHVRVISHKDLRRDVQLLSLGELQLAA